MKNIFLFFSILSLSTFSITAQNALSDPNIDQYITQKSISTSYLGEEYTGSPYANEEFQNGTVYGTNEVLATNVALRYNVLKDEIEIKSNLNTSNSNARVLQKSDNISVRIMNDLYIYRAPAEDSDVSGYFLVIIEGDKLSLFKKIKKKYIEGKKSINSIASDVLPTYRELDELYILSDSGELTEVPGSRSKRINLFSDKKAEIKQYIKSEKINVNKEYELKNLVKYYNSL